MIDERTFGILIGAIYDAAVDVGLWPAALRQIADAYGAPSAGLAGQGRASSDCWGIMERLDPAAVERYCSYYHSVNPIWSRVPRTPVGTVQIDSMVMPKNEFVRTEFYNDYLKPLGIGSMLNAVVLLDDDAQTVLTVQGREEFEADDIRLHRLLAPHLQRAAEINRKLAMLQLYQDASLPAIDLLGHGALLVDASARVLVANGAADRLLAAGVGLGVTGRILRGGAEAETARLRRLVAGCAAKRAPSGVGGSLSLSRGAGKAPLLVLVTPLRCEVPWYNAGRPVALILVSDPDRETGPRLEQIKGRFGLTGAEAAFAREIMKGDGIRAAANRLSISRATARTHLAHIFDKTGTHRQAELVGLLSGVHGGSFASDES